MAFYEMEFYTLKFYAFEMIILPDHNKSHNKP